MAIKKDVIYAADHDQSTNPGFKPGITVGSVPDGKATAFIPVPSEQIGAPEGITADSQGNIYGGYGDNRNLRRFVKK